MEQDFYYGGFEQEPPKRHKYKTLDQYYEEQERHSKATDFSGNSREDDDYNVYTENY